MKLLLDPDQRRDARQAPRDTDLLEAWFGIAGRTALAEHDSRPEDLSGTND